MKRVEIKMQINIKNIPEEILSALKLQAKESKAANFSQYIIEIFRSAIVNNGLSIYDSELANLAVEIKKQQAKEYIIHSLNEMNLSITEQQLDMFVEAAVKRAKDEWNKPEVVVVDEPKVDKKLLEEAEKLFEKEEIK